MESCSLLAVVRFTDFGDSEVPLVAAARFGRLRQVLAVQPSRIQVRDDRGLLLT
jgi:hypothetical protein